ncbi:MAG: hypothetical protein ACK5PD_01770 [Pirellulaceae bacterium]|jgi:hypothetical protein
MDPTTPILESAPRLGSGGYKDSLGFLQLLKAQDEQANFGINYDFAVSL